MAEPTAIPIEISILPRMANMIAAACSAALPTIGSKIVPMNSVGMPSDSAAGYIQHANGITEEEGYGRASL